jgi:hypothetical protein
MSQSGQSFCQELAFGSKLDICDLTNKSENNYIKIIWEL